jgi:PAS domain S-box-containing protein
MDQALKESEQRYREFISRSIDGVWRVEFEEPLPVDLPENELLTRFLREGVMAECNDAMARLYGLSGPEELIGRSLGDLPMGLDAGRMESYSSAVRARFQPRSITFRTANAAGKSLCVIRTEVPTIEDGKLVRYWGMTRDITDLKFAEEALRESEQRYRTLFENSPVGIYRTTPDGRILAGNPAFARMMGYSSFEELASRNLNAPDFEPGYSRSQFKEQLEKEGRIDGLERQWRRRDGSVIFVRENARAIRDDSGRLLCYEGTSEDVTERKQMEDSLRDSEERFRSLVENATVGIYRTTPDGRILMANPALVKMMGCESFEELACRNLEEEGFEPNYPRSEFKAQIEREGEIAGLEEAWIRRDGTTIFVRESARAKRGPNGNVSYYDGIVEDVTEHRRAEESRRYLASIVESSDDAIFGTSCEGVIQSWNKGAERLYGYTAAEMIGQSVSLLASQDQWGEIASLRDRINRGDDVQRYETVRVRKDGSQVDVLTTLSSIKDACGRVIGASIIAHDITKRKRAQQELERSLEQLRALGARLQNVREEERKLLAREIHDQLGQALTAIKIDLFAWVSQMGGDPQHPSQGASALLRLVDETIKRVRRIATELRPGILDDLGLVAAIEWAGEDFEARTGIKCRLDLPGENIAISPERATAIFRILQESLTNVVRHAAASEVKIRLGEKDKELILLVRDNGKGMRMDKLSRTSSLGILGMHERALVFGGEVIIKAAPGKGTSVRVRIPQVCLT